MSHPKKGEMSAPFKRGDMVRKIAESSGESDFAYDASKGAHMGSVGVVKEVRQVHTLYKHEYRVVFIPGIEALMYENQLEKVGECDDIFKGKLDD